MHDWSISELSRRLRHRDVSSVEVTTALVRRIEEIDTRLHSYVAVTADHALAQAKQADAELARGFDRGPLHGVPVALKDMIFTASAPTAVGSSFMGALNPRANATVVDRLERAGAVLLGKLAMPEGALAGYPDPEKAPVNPWNARMWTGVSSSGSGVATAAGLCYGALGTDTGGSIRFPSAANAVTGLKPTWGRVSRHGVFAMAEARDTVGPMARNAADAAAMLMAIAGRDAKDPTSRPEPVENCLAEIAGGVSGLRIGVDRDDLAANVEPAVARALEEAANVLQERGARIVPVRLPSPRAYLGVYSASTMSSVALAHGEIYAAHAERYGPVMRRVIEAGLASRGLDVAKAEVERLRYSGEVAALFETIEVLLVPVLPVALPTAREMAEMTDPTQFARTRGIYTLPFNATGHPSLTLPCGFSDGDVPIGFQLIGRPLSEALLLRAGHAYQQLTDFHTRRPAP